MLSGDHTYQSDIDGKLEEAPSQHRNRLKMLPIRERLETSHVCHGTVIDPQKAVVTIRGGDERPDDPSYFDFVELAYALQHREELLGTCMRSRRYV